MLTQKNQPNKFTDDTKWGRVTYAGNGYSSVQKHPEVQAPEDVNPKDTRGWSQQQPYEIWPGQVQCLAHKQDDPKNGTARGWQAGLPPCWRGAGTVFELLTELTGHVTMNKAISMQSCENIDQGTLFFLLLNTDVVRSGTEPG